ncbi:DUF3570 domain-containing protein [Mucilaginibacter sp. L3T2-6]|uniref:DUF3570 domain-containing protein n=1 Tax=Mucilaginibacter sp. L3T2-6 TaxID=3062491 RepID=UPI002675E98F|nr:DUF3570 domain-containing protein [Mucilaginibacter sp. L3T2-6]MDO3641446.1 DUF3570 domain-containing protein [Mucilaginibacter sp. L3T2-6]MDV6213793.1 DUF3570 domain-containing protein [Mucilaginibacter sp. L3T2-6]
MRKIYLSAIGFSLLCRLNTSAQATKDSTSVNKTPVTLSAPVKTDTSGYKSRKLHIDEIDFVTSYYGQTGNHSAVTGGIGTEQVTDIANGLTLNMVWQNKANIKNTLELGLGFDYHSAASQAYVSKTGASSPTGTRLYPSLDWTAENTKTGTSFGAGAYYSGEFNYQSLGAGLHFSQKTSDRNGEFSAKVQGYFDKVTLIYPSEFEPVTSTYPNFGEGDHEGRRNYDSSPRTTLSASLSYSQMINSRLQVMLLGDLVTQHGFLSLPFHRVYFNNGKDTIERLPSSRFKLPVGIRLNYFLGDNIIIRSYYRYYRDNWGIKSNTAGIEVPYKITPFLSISPFYRFYNQSAAKYFAPYETHNASEQYFTSNYEYAKFNSQFFGVGFRLAPPAGVFGWQNLHELEIRYGHYTQTTDLVSNVISLNLGFK